MSTETASRMALHAFLPCCQANFWDGFFPCLGDPTCLRSRHELQKIPPLFKQTGRKPQHVVDQCDQLLRVLA